MNSRAQGISVNVIIIAAIALIVMVILIALVLNTGGDINRTVNDCSAQGDGISGEDYYCADTSLGESCPEGFIRNPQRSCPGSTQDSPIHCCVALR